MISLFYFIHIDHGGDPFDSDPGDGHCQEDSEFLPNILKLEYADYQGIWKNLYEAENLAKYCQKI